MGQPVRQASALACEGSMIVPPHRRKKKEKIVKFSTKNLSIFSTTP